MMMMMRCWIVLFWLFASVSATSKSFTGPTKKCFDQSCDGTLFVSKATRAHVGNHADFLDLTPGETIKVVAIDFSDRPDLWEGEKDGKRGFFFGNHVERQNYLEFLKTAVDSDITLHVLQRDPRAKITEKYVGKVTASEALKKVREVEENKLAEEKGEEPPHKPSPPSHGHGHSHGGHGHSHSFAGHTHSHAPPEEKKQVVLPETWLNIKTEALKFVSSGDFTEKELVNAEAMIKSEVENGRDGAVMIDLMGQKLKQTVRKRTAKQRKPKEQLAKVPANPQSPNEKVEEFKWEETAVEQNEEAKNPEENVMHSLVMETVTPIPQKQETPEQPRGETIEQKPNAVHGTFAEAPVAEKVASDSTPPSQNSPESTISPSHGGKGPELTPPPTEQSKSQVVLPQQNNPGVVGPDTEIPSAQKVPSNQPSVEVIYERKNVPEAQNKTKNIPEEQSVIHPAPELAKKVVVEETKVGEASIPNASSEIPPVATVDSSVDSLLQEIKATESTGESGVGSGTHPTLGSILSHSTPPVIDTEKTNAVPLTSTQATPQLEIPKPEVHENRAQEVTTVPTATAAPQEWTTISSGSEPPGDPIPMPPVADPEKHTEVKDAFGQEFCIKGDCQSDDINSNAESEQKHDEHHEHEHHEHPEDPELAATGESTSHLDHLHDNPPPQGETFRSKVESLRSWCSPIVNGLNWTLNSVRRIFPRTTQQAMDDAGVDNLALLMVLLVPFTSFMYIVQRGFSGSAGYQRRVSLHQFSKMCHEKKSLEIENERLRKSETQIKADGAASQEELREFQAAKEHAEDKAMRLKQEVATLQQSNDFLEKELKRDREDLKSLKEKTEAARQKREKLQKESESLKDENHALCAQIKELKETCETCMERNAKLEQKLEDESQKLNEKERSLKRLEASSGELKLEWEEVSREAEELRRHNSELEIELSGLKAIVENLHIPSGGGSRDATDSPGSANGWEDIGGKDDEEKKRLHLAELKNVAQLHAKIKQMKEELDKSKVVAQKETDLRVSLDSQLTLAQDDLAKLRHKLDLADGERRDLLAQVKKMTEMVDSKDKEVQSRVDDLNKKLDRLRDENDRLNSEYTQEKSEKEVLDDKYRDMSEAYSRVKRELERNENKTYHDMRDKDTQIRQMKVELMQMRMSAPKRPDSTGAPISPGGVNAASSHSSEAEMAQISSAGPDVSGGSGGFPVDDIWTLPAASRPPRWEEPYDSPPSSVDYQMEGSTRRRPKSKTRGSPANRRRPVEDLVDSGEGNPNTKDRRSRSRGKNERERSRSPELEASKNHKPKRRTKSKGRSPLDTYGAYPSPMFPPAGFDPYFGPPPPQYYGRRSNYYSSGGSATGGRSPPPPQMPLVGGLPPPGVKEVKPIGGKPRPKSTTDSRGK